MFKVLANRPVTAVKLGYCVIYVLGKLNHLKVCLENN